MNSSAQPRTRTLRPVLALLSSLIVLGLGFVYVGEISLAIASIAALYGIIALFSWTRLMIKFPYGFDACLSISLIILLVSIVAPVAMSIRGRNSLRKAYNRWWFYCLWILAMAAISIAAFSSRETVFGYGLYRIPSTSMSPTIQRGDYILTDAWRYPSHKVVVGDIVILDIGDGTGVRYEKRVVGIAGDRIEIRDRVLYRNRSAISEPYIAEEDGAHFFGRDFGPALVGAEQVFVLGDDRDNSKDSRWWGGIPTSQLHGRAEFVWLSIGDQGIRWDRIGKELHP